MKKSLYILLILFIASCKKTEIKPVSIKHERPVLLNYRIYGFIPDSSCVMINDSLIEPLAVGYHVTCKHGDTLHFYFSRKKQSEQIGKAQSFEANLAIWVDKNEMPNISYFKLINGVNYDFIKADYIVK